MLLTTATHTEGPVSPAGVSPTLACEDEAGYKAWPLHERWPFSATFSYLLPREPLEAFLGAPQIGPRTDDNDKANGIFVRCETLQAGCRPEPPLMVCADFQSHLRPEELSEFCRLAGVGPITTWDL